MTTVAAASPLVRLSRRGLQASEHRILLVVGDLAIASLAVVVALWLWTITAGVTLSFALRARAYWFFAVAAWVIGLAPTYNIGVALSVQQTVRALVRLASLLLVGYLAVYFYAPRQALPRLLALYFLWEALLLTLGWRLVYIWVFTETGLRRRALIVGTGQAGERLLEVMQQAGVRETMVVGLVEADGPARRGSVLGVPVLGGGDALTALVEREGISELILAAEELRGPLLERLLECQEAGVDIVPMATVYEQTLQRLPIEYLERDWLFRSYAEAVRAKDSSRLVKRLVDVLAGTAGSLAFVLLAPFIALVIWLDSGRPIFYSQRRVGRGGREFRLLKFRTMVPDAEANGQAQWAGPSDPRTTRVGRFLRRTRLDELPNFLSVFRGDMSLVGPRPERPEFVATLEREVPFYRARLMARPGLTGWAQVNYPYGDSIEDAAAKLEYDLYYLKHRSFVFDVWIIARTVGTVLTFRGR